MAGDRAQPAGARSEQDPHRRRRPGRRLQCRTRRGRHDVRVPDPPGHRGLGDGLGAAAVVARCAFAHRSCTAISSRARRHSPTTSSSVEARTDRVDAVLAMLAAQLEPEPLVLREGELLASPTRPASTVSSARATPRPRRRRPRRARTRPRSSILRCGRRWRTASSVSNSCAVRGSTPAAPSATMASPAKASPPASTASWSIATSARVEGPSRTSRSRPTARWSPRWSTRPSSSCRPASR